MQPSFKAFLFYSWIFLSVFCLSSCSLNDDEDIRTPDDIMGIWLTPDNKYLDFEEENIVEVFMVEYQDGESIGKWGNDEVYYYEPGYQLVIYLSNEHEANIYEVVELTDSRLVWCWVDQIDVNNETENIGKVIGDIINKAQEGYHLDPELYQTFTKVSEDQFLSLLESMDIIYYPWEY